MTIHWKINQNQAEADLKGEGVGVDCLETGFEICETYYSSEAVVPIVLGSEDSNSEIIGLY